MAPPNPDDAAALNEKPMSAWEAAAAMGIDMSLIEVSLSLTPAERLFQHDCALHTVLMLEAAAKKQNG